MRVIRFAFIALLLSATCAQAQNLRVVPRISNRRAAWEKKMLQLPSLVHPRPAQAAAVPGLEEPTALAFDSSGNLYIAAPALQQILKVTPQGVVSVFAGTGSAGYTGDGGPAVDATFEDPFGVTLDGSGNVFIADTKNNVVREVTTDGNIKTVAGPGPVCTTGATDAVGDGCQATAATLNQPEGVGIDVNGNLLIADTSNLLVRRVDKSTGVISVVAGGATSLCAGALNNIGDGCPGTNAVLRAPVGLATDTLGNIFIADVGLSAIRAVNAAGVINVYAGNYTTGFTADNVPALSATLDQPMGVAVDASGDLYLADGVTNEIRLVNHTTHLLTDAAGNAFGPSAYSGDGGPATSATFFTVRAVAVSPTNGNLYISDMFDSQVRTVDKNSGIISTFVAPTMTIPQAFIELDKQVINTSTTQTTTFTNTSGAALTISSALVQGAGYTETDNCVGQTLTPGQSCSVFTTFTPTQVCEVDANNNGINSGVVFLEHNGPGGFSFVEFVGDGADAGGLSVTDLTNDSLSPASIAQSLVGTGITISNVTYNGAPQAAGTFSGGQNIIGFDSGVILSAGSLANVVGPNCETGISRNNGLPGDADLQALLPANSTATMDAADLEFDFVPVGNSVNFKYVFASDEYNEEVGFFDDVFGLFVNGANAALLPGTNTAVSVNTVNDGDSRDSSIPISNPQFFINNDFQFPTAAPLDTEMDGMTVVLTVNVAVNAGVTNHVKLAIADTGDHVFDSNVFIAGGSLNSSPLRLSVGTLAFGNEAVGATSPPQTVSLTNGGASAVAIASITPSAGYTDTTTCGASLPANQSCNVTVSFAPTGAGAVQGLLTVTSNANGPNTVQTVSLSGTGVQPLTITLPASVAFPAQAQGTTSAPMIVTVTNNATSVVNAVLSTATTTGPFAVAGGSCTFGGAGITPDNSCTILVTFTPTGTAPSSGTLVIEDNATGNPQTVTLSGTTSAQSVTVTFTPPSLTFPAQAQNTTSAPMTVTVKNTSTSATNVTFSNISTTGPFAVSGGTCSTTGPGIAQNATCTITVTFTPTGTAPSSGNLSVTDNAAGSPQLVPLNGTTTAQPVTVTFTPPSLTFPATVQNVTSAPLTVTVKNTSTSATNVTFSAISTTGPFAVSGGTCSTTGPGIAQNATCTITVTFTPTGTAPSSGNLSVTDNATGSPQLVPLSGTTAALTVTFTPPSLTFPATVQNVTSSPLTVTVKNTSNTATNITFSAISTTGPFAVSGGTCSTTGPGIAQNATCTITVTFTPTGTAPSSGNLSVTDNATGSPQLVPLSGTTFIQTISLTTTPPSVTFPAQIVNTTSAPMTVSVKNTSNFATNITFSNISTTGPFAVSGGTCSTSGAGIAQNATCTITVTFTPTGTAPSSGNLSITDNATGSPQLVALSGTTTVQTISVTVTPGALTFPATLQNTTSNPMTVTVKNTSTGGGTITFTSISTGEGPFAVSGGSCAVDSSPLAAGASCTITVTFTPTGTVPSSGTLSIADNAPNSPQSVTLNGTTLIPVISVQITPGSLTFPATAQNTTSNPMSVTVKNTSTGGGTISFTSISAGDGGPFAVSGGTCSTDASPLAAGASCTIAVTFTPSGTNPSSGTLTISDNAPNSPQSVPLNGTTLVPQTTVTVAPTSLTFPSTLQNTTSAPMSVTVTNTSNNGAVISFPQISASGPFAVASGSCIDTNGVTVGNSCTINVTFTPTGTDPSSGTLTITDNAIDSPQTVALSGTTQSPNTFTLTAGGNGSTSATVNPGDTAVFPIVLTGSPGTSGTVDLSCEPSTPTITCSVTPTSIVLTGTGSVNTGISVTTFCSGTPPVAGPSGRWGAPRLLIIPVASLLGLILMIFVCARTNRRPWAPALAAVVFLAVGAAGCKSLAKGPNGKTLPGTYTLTLTGTLNGQSQSINLTLVVK